MSNIDLQAHALALALHICSKVLREAPDERFLSEVREHRLFAAWPLKPLTKEAAVALADMDREYGASAKDSRDDAAALRLDHLALFSGPTPMARPWESVWREKDQLLFGEQTMLVREQYAAWGLTIDNFGHVPEDHIALELAFCVHLLHHMATGDNGAATEILVAFLDRHLLQWAAPCLRKASEEAAETFYRCMPLLCLDTLNGLRAVLGTYRKTE